MASYLSVKHRLLISKVVDGDNVTYSCAPLKKSRIQSLKMVCKRIGVKHYD